MGRIFNIFAAAFCSIGSLLFGYDSGVITSVLTMSHFNSHFNNPTSSMVGAVVSTFTGGCFFGAAASGWWNDRFGRKRTIQIGSVWALWGCAMQAGAGNVATLLLGRIIAGFAIGCLSATVPLYNTEIAPPQIRGFVVGLAQLMIGIGFIVANWVGYGCQFINSDAQWRIPLGLQLIPALLLLIGIQFLPESPRWLIEHNQDDHARAVVIRLHGARTNIPSPALKAAEAEFAEMHDAIHAEMHVRSRHIRDLFATRAMTKRTLVAIGVQVFTQCTGINVINYYGPSMYKSLGLSSGQALLLQGIYSGIGAVAIFFFITLLADRVGRKKPLIFGSVFFVAAFSTLSAILASFPPTTEGTTTSAPAQRAGIAIIFLVCVVFSLSFGPVSWVLASEVFPTRSRALGTSVATCANWLFNVVFSQASPTGLVDVGWRYYLLFVCLNAVSCVVILVYFPETKGKSLEDMAEIFGDQVDASDVLARHGEVQLVHDDVLDKRSEE